MICRIAVHPVPIDVDFKAWDSNLEKTGKCLVIGMKAESGLCVTCSEGVPETENP